MAHSTVLVDEIPALTMDTSGRGDHVQVTALGHGSVEMSVGHHAWAIFSRDEVLDLIHALTVASGPTIPDSASQLVFDTLEIEL